MRRSSRREPTFTITEVCKALPVPRGTLGSWAHHHPDFFRKLDAGTTVPGRARQYTRKDLTKLAIFKRLLDFGMKGERATGWAEFCVQYIDYYGHADHHGRLQITEMHVFLYPDDHQEIRFNDNVMTSPVTPGFDLRLVISVVPIIEGMKVRLENDVAEIDRLKHQTNEG
jgi:hypothetical protein